MKNVIKADGLKNVNKADALKNVIKSGYFITWRILGLVNLKWEKEGTRGVGDMGHPCQGGRGPCPPQAGVTSGVGVGFVPIAGGSLGATTGTLAGARSLLHTLLASCSHSNQLQLLWEMPRAPKGSL